MDPLGKQEFEFRFGCSKGPRTHMVYYTVYDLTLELLCRKSFSRNMRTSTSVHGAVGIEKNLSSVRSWVQGHGFRIFHYYYVVINNVAVTPVIITATIP